MKRGALYSFGWYLLYPIFKLLFFFKVNGRENIPENGGFILCSNHLSNFDPVLLALSQKRQIFYMAKAELFKNKFFGALIRKLGAFPVERGAGDGKAIEMAESIIKDEKMLGIFIEGTRSKTGEFLRPKSGAAIIAHQMKATVIPVCITPKNQKIKVFQRVKIRFGKPLTPEELGLNGEAGPEVYRTAARRIMSEIQSLREIDLK